MPGRSGPTVPIRFCPGRLTANTGDALAMSCPAIIPNPTLEVGMNANWYGLNKYLWPKLVTLPSYVPLAYRHVIFGVRPRRPVEGDMRMHVKHARQNPLA